MCCFAGPAATRSLWARLFSPKPLRVSATRIFARKVDATTQALAYAMRLSVGSEVAMVLPLPVAPRAHTDGLRFIDLSREADLFERLEQLFAPEVSRQKANAPQAGGLLAVVRVGSFEASFVPGLADFARLDPRFRLPPALFERYPAYADYGFAVFRLAPGQHEVHPMGLAFETRDQHRLFFPTVHVHDGRVHDKAHFDHTLYYQAGGPASPADEAPPTGGRTSHFLASAPRDLFAPDLGVFRRRLRGKLENRDTWI